MKIPAWLFFSFWAVISITFLHLGFDALDKTALSTSVPPVIMSVFKHSLAISSCFSSTHALISRPQSLDHVLQLYLWVAWGILLVLYYRIIKWTYFWGWPLWLWCVISYYLISFSTWLLDSLPKLKISADRFCARLVDFLPELKILAEACSSLIMFLCSVLSYVAILCILTAALCVALVFVTLLGSIITPVLFLTTLPFNYLTPIFIFLNFIIITGDIKYVEIPELKIRIVIHMAVETSLWLVSGENTQFFPIVVLLLSCCISASCAAFTGFEPVLGNEVCNVLLPISAEVKERKMGKMIEFAVGLVGALVFQNFFRLTSFNEVMAFLYLAVMWLANLGLLGLSYDFGVLNFLLGNVVVGCTVSQFGLQTTTWFAYSACLVVHGLRLKLESLTLLYGQGQHIQVKLWS